MYFVFLLKFLHINEMYPVLPGPIFKASALWADALTVYTELNPNTDCISF